MSTIFVSVCVHGVCVHDLCVRACCVCIVPMICVREFMFFACYLVCTICGRVAWFVYTYLCVHGLCAFSFLFVVFVCPWFVCVFACVFGRAFVDVWACWSDSCVFSCTCGRVSAFVVSLRVVSACVLCLRVCACVRLWLYLCVCLCLRLHLCQRLASV